MKTVLITRGIPGCGKSTWIEKNGLKPYTICYDDLKLLFLGPVLDNSGELIINQGVNLKVFKLAYEILEEKMKKGEFVVLDGTHSLKKDFEPIRKLAKKYLYRMICVDFTDIPLDVIKEQNKSRDLCRIIPDKAIEKFKNRFLDKQNTIPSGIIVIKPNELDKILFKTINLSKYKKIHHFGDIHGCYSVLQKFLNNNIKDDEAYIFCGDYIDRGIENIEVLKFMMDIIDKPNVFCLEGNHERWLWKWAHNEEVPSLVFKNITFFELEKAEINKKDINRFYRKLIPCAYYTYGEKTVFVSHGGISSMITNPIFLSTEQLIKGVGRYPDSENVDMAFAKYAVEKDINLYQIQGHRNINEVPIEVPNTDGRCFNLEGQIEFGKYLRVVTLSQNGFETFEIRNDIYKETPLDKVPKNKDLLLLLRESPYVTEKSFGRISSFNFTRDAFYKKHWDSINTKARGLYLDNVSGTVLARGYDKFFNLNENENTTLNSLKDKLKFPVNAYIKENGYLGIVSVVDGELFITTKSNPEAEYAQNFKSLFYKLVKNPEKIKDFIIKHNCSFVFEVIDIENDPHIIEYKENKLILLDIIDNDIKFKRYPYSSLLLIAKELNLQIKKLYKTFNTFDELTLFIDEVNKGENHYPPSLKVLNYIEGFVFSDADDYQFKLKLEYYNKWKLLRNISHGILNNPVYEVPKKYEIDKESKKFIEWLKENKTEIIKKVVKTDIISLRKKFKEKENYYD